MPSTPSTGSDLSVRRATRTDEPAILDLVRLSLGERGIHRTPDYWRWKHEANPFGQSPTLIAEDGPRLVGLRTFMRWTWKCGGAAVPAVRAVDTATHPDYRGRGIFKRLTLQLRDEVQAEGIPFVYNTPNSQSRPGYLKMGWTLVGRPTIWMRPVHPVRLLGALRRDASGHNEERPPIDAPAAGDVLREPGVEGLVAAAVDAAEPLGRYHTRRTIEYLRWRYADIPGFTYRAVTEGQGADGALVLVRSRYRGDVRELRVCDLVVGPTAAARRNAGRLLRRMPRLAAVDMVIAMPAGRADLRRVLVGAGYVPVPRSGPIFTTYPFAAADELPNPRHLKNWAPSIGDLELF